MDEEAGVSFSIGAQLRSAALLLFCVTFSGCFAPDPKPIAVTSPDVFMELARSTAQLRELPFEQPLHLQTEAQETVADRTPPVSLAQLEPAYKAIALAANSVDFGRALVEYRKLLRLIVYDDPKKIVIVNATATRLGAPLAANHPAAARELPGAMGVVHALQERRFHWREKILASASAEHRLALRTVAVGDALLTALSRSLSEKPQSAHLSLALQVAAEVDRRANQLPDFLRRRAVFPYREGSHFVYWAFAARGWKGVDALYTDPPRVSAQVFHPEKFFIRREAPVNFFPVALLGRLKTHTLIEDVIGELSVRSLLERAFGATSAADTAGSWRGDQLFAFQRNGDMDLFWFSAWKDETAAAKFLMAHRRVLEEVHRLRLERVAQAKDLALIGAARNQRAWLLQRRGALVLTVHGATANRVTELAQDAWRDLEVEAEPAAVRFESARRSGINFR